MVERQQFRQAQDIGVQNFKKTKREAQIFHQVKEERRKPGQQPTGAEKDVRKVWIFREGNLQVSQR